MNPSSAKQGSANRVGVYAILALQRNLEKLQNKKFFFIAVWNCPKFLLVFSIDELLFWQIVVLVKMRCTDLIEWEKREIDSKWQLRWSEWDVVQVYVCSFMCLGERKRERERVCVCQCVHLWCKLTALGGFHTSHLEAELMKTLAEVLKVETSQVIAHLGLAALLCWIN